MGAPGGSFHFGEIQIRTFPKAFLALSRDVGTVRVSTVTQPRSSAAKAVLRDRGRASLRLRPASSSSSSRFTTSCAPCRATTTARARAVRTSSLISQGLGVCQTNRSIIYICVCHKLCGLTGRFATQDEFLPRVMTSYTVQRRLRRPRAEGASFARRARWWRRRL